MNRYLRWEKRLKIKVVNSLNKPIQKNLNNCDLFDMMDLPEINDSSYAEYKLVQRYYVAHLHRDALGDWILTKVRGGIGTARGQVIHYYCSTREKGMQLIETLKQIRKQRKYKLVCEY